VLGSDPACAARLRPLLDAGRARFEVGDLLRLPYADASFDVALSFRLLPHLDEWRSLVAELCRVARRAVIVDYPSRRSANAFAEAFFSAKQGVEGNTRPFLVFRDADVTRAFAAAGFAPSGRRREYFVPMALHRALGSAGASRGLEALCAAFGLRAAFGSPVILRAEPAAARAQAA
jgi:SAM-dependent methyltransferase